MGTNQARDQILRSIRENLAASAPLDEMTHDPRSAPPLASPGPRPQAPDLTTRSTTQLDAVRAQWTLVRGEVEAARALRRILSDAGARRGAGSAAAPVARLLPDRPTRVPPAALFTW